jgi:hypothetical protein
MRAKNNGNAPGDVPTASEIDALTSMHLNIDASMLSEMACKGS